MQSDGTIQTLNLQFLAKNAGNCSESKRIYEIICQELIELAKSGNIVATTVT